MLHVSSRYRCLTHFRLIIESHLHFLQWREVGRDLEGVIKIGAVNCGEEFFLCNQESITGYPSLIMYPAVSK